MMEKLKHSLDNLEADQLNEFRWYLKNGLVEGFSAIPAGQLNKDQSCGHTVDLMVQHFGPNRALDLTVNVLQLVDRNDLVKNLLPTGVPAPQTESINFYQNKLQSNLNNKVRQIEEKRSKWKVKDLLNDVYIDLHVIEGSDVQINTQHEVRHVEKALRRKSVTQKSLQPSNIFKHPSGKNIPVRTVLTNGIAGIGKTFLVQKVILDWSENQGNLDAHLVFPFSFRELSHLRGETCTLSKLIHRSIRETKFIGEQQLDKIFTELQTSGNTNYDDSKYKLLFVLDGLDESRLQLRCATSQKSSEDIDVTEATTVDELVTNLITGQLLPSARLWITTRPAAARLVHASFVDMVTEVRGFNNEQKEAYFRKRFPEEKHAKIISYLKTSRSLYIMCHIPIFCRMTATVLTSILEKEELPKGLTDMYTKFLFCQVEKNKEKYDIQKSQECILSLAKMSFNQMETDNLIFYEEDLKQSGIDVEEASLFSGVFTEVFGVEEDEEDGGKMFSFIHRSVQEYLAAVYVLESFTEHGKNVLGSRGWLQRLLMFFWRTSLAEIHKSAIDRALQSPNGHWDLFLRFLLGLSATTNQKRQRSFLKGMANTSNARERTVQYIKEKLSGKSQPSAEATINLFHCLKELKDDSLLTTMQQQLGAGRLSRKSLSPMDWSALAYILQTSEEHVDMFDLKKYSDSEEPFLRLLSAFQWSSTYLLACCNLSPRSCEALSLVLSSQTCCLTQLDLTNNDLEDSGVALLCSGLEEPYCKLQTLRLSGCLITHDGCAHLAQALKHNTHLRELDLSFNHPGDRMTEELRDSTKNRLDTLKLLPQGNDYIRRGLRKYSCRLRLDVSTADPSLQLSDNNRRVTLRLNHRGPVAAAPRAAPTEETLWRWQVLCTNALRDRHYWEVEWTGAVDIAVAYGGMARRGRFGMNRQSWSLRCSDLLGHAVYHDNTETTLSQSLDLNRVGVYVDWTAGVVSFYVVDGDVRLHLHTFNDTFTEPLYPGFSVGCVPIGSYLLLCDMS